MGQIASKFVVKIMPEQIICYFRSCKSSMSLRKRCLSRLKNLLKGIVAVFVVDGKFKAVIPGGASVPCVRVENARGTHGL